MQYEITLPADYDMNIIRERVATRGHLLDDFPGLGLKAYLMRERGADSPVNQYAPLYLWTAPEGMNDFLWGRGFAGVVDDFGRPDVQHWTGLAFHEGRSASSRAQTAIRRRRRVPAGVLPGPVVEEALAETGRLAALDGAVCAALAIDPRNWELLYVTLWDHDSPEAAGDWYQVLHLSQPERSALRPGRHW